MYVYPFLLQHCFSSELRHFFLNEYMVIASLAIRFGHWIPIKLVKIRQEQSTTFREIQFSGSSSEPLPSNSFILGCFCTWSTATVYNPSLVVSSPGKQSPSMFICGNICILGIYKSNKIVICSIFIRGVSQIQQHQICSQINE